MRHAFTAVIHQEDGLYVAERPELGAVSQGTSIDDAIADLKEATELYIEEMSDAGAETSLIVQGRQLIATFEAVSRA